jgi:hypothetical protein
LRTEQARAPVTTAEIATEALHCDTKAADSILRSLVKKEFVSVSYVKNEKLNKHVKAYTAKVITESSYYN